MKKESLLIWILLFFLVACKTTTQSTASGSQPEKEEPRSAVLAVKLDSLLINHQYFTAGNLFAKHKDSLSQHKRLVIKSQLEAAFNNRKRSNQNIERLFLAHENKLTPLEQVLLLETAAINSLFLYDYDQAHYYTKVLLTMQEVVGEKRKEHENNLLIYRALKEVPQQTIQVEESRLPITKDQVGLSRIPVSVNGRKEQVVFDTGANFSVITDSLALKVGLEIMETNFKVISITGVTINSRLAIADHLQIGNSSLEHVVFLVFPEGSLSFPQIDYTIDAILGFPVINALEEIQLVQGSQFRITRGSTTKTPTNMALDFLTPLIEVLNKDDSLSFTFDTGATTTALYSAYFRLKEEEIRKAGIRDTIMIGGAGGATQVPIHIHPFAARIGDSHFTLDSAAVYQEDLRASPGIHGNLGQDVLGQFDTLSLNFRQMWIELK